MQVEDYGQGSWRLNALDHWVVSTPRADHTLRRKDHPVPTGLDVCRRQLAAIVELDPLVEREGIGQVIVGDCPGFGQVADDLRIVMRVEHDQVVIDGAHRLGHHEGLLLVHVQARRITRQRRVQDTTTPWFLVSQGRRRGPQPCDHYHTEHEADYFAMSHTGPLLFVGRPGFTRCLSKPTEGGTTNGYYFSASHTSSRRRFIQ